MMFRTFACRAALVVGLLFSLALGARTADACDGAACRSAPAAKPLDLMKFMHGKSSTQRNGTSHAAKAQHVASRHVTRARHTSTAQAEPASQAEPATTAFASEPASNAAEPDVQVVVSDELNDIDRAAAQVQAETNGAAPSGYQSARMVEAEQFNDIDRKTAGLPVPTADQSANDRETSAASMSWLEHVWSSWSSWVWTSLSAAFMTVRQLFG